MVVGLFAVCVTALHAVSRLIGAVESAGQRSYDAGVFTNFRISFWKTDELSAAMALWRDTQNGVPGFDVERLLSWHLGIDALLFVPTYSVLLYLLLRRVSASKRVAVNTALATAFADWMETAATWFFLVWQHLRPSSAIWIIQALTFLKWVAIAWSLATVVVFWIQQQVEQRRNKGGAPPLLLRGYDALTSITVIVVVFTALVAFPAGGPLDQIPDVLRAQFSPSVSWLTRGLSSAALALLAASVATGAALAADPRANPVPRKLVRNWVVLLVAGVISLALLLSGGLFEHHWRVATLAPALVVVAIWAAAKLATIVGASKRQHKLHDAWENVDPINAYAAARYIGALAGVIIVAGGIGLLRAAFPAWVLGVRPGVAPWWLLSLLAVAVVLGGGFIAQRRVMRVLGTTPAPADPTKSRRRAFGVMTAAFTLVLAAWLTVYPDHARFATTSGVIAIGFSAFAIAVGWLAWVARERIAWEATQTLGIGIHTSWLGMVVAAWLVASLLNTTGAYHDARVDLAPRPLAPRYPNLDSAFAAWLRAQSATECTAASGDIPLVLVAAPGGGIRAAYWTAYALDTLFGIRGIRCATTPIFAMSGVSGGSVGITTWVAAAAAGRKGRTAVSGMADDRALASAAVGLFFRDALQPLLTFTTWRDRAALLEDGWEHAAGSPLAGVTWDNLGNGLSWMPVIVLNGSSVNDGCRVLIANVGGLPAERERDCNESPHVAAAGAVSSAIDGIAGLHARADTSCAAGRAQLRAATAALLSARFPFVSPSGALIRCRPSASLSPAAESLRTETYVVDGGYYENSGLLTLLQMWRAVEPLVRQENVNGVSRPRRIVPWLVLIDNHYRSAASAAPQRRTLELLVPLKALTSGSVASQPALQQMAWGEIAGDGAHCKSGDSATTLAAVPAQAPRGCVVAVAPMVSPGVGAPLGWVLSDMSRRNMDDQMQQRFATGAGADARLMTLRRLIGLPGATTSARGPIRP
jgi:hypothetical protein